MLGLTDLGTRLVGRRPRREAGLVEVARLEERSGGTTKYYRANTIVLSYALPDDAREDVAEMAESIAPDVAALVDDLESEYGETIDRIAGEMAPYEHCRDQKYETYLRLMILRRAFVRGAGDREWELPEIESLEIEDQPSATHQFRNLVRDADVGAEF